MLRCVDISPPAAESRSRRWLSDRRLRTKILAPVALALVGTGAVLWSGIDGLGATGGDASGLYAHTAVPMADLAKVRDGEGDARVQVRDYVLGAPGSTPADIRTDMAATDRNTDEALSAFVTDHGSTLGADRVELVTKVRNALQAWRAVRDNQVLPAVDRHDAAQVTALLGGPLTQADDAFATPLDDLFTRETQQAGTVARGAERDARRQQLIMIVVAVAAALLAAAAGLVITRLTVGRLQRVQRVLGALARGDLTDDAGPATRDEVGQMAGALATACTALRGTVGTLAESATALASTGTELAATSSRMSSRADQSAAQTAVVAGAAEVVSRNVQTMATGAEQLQTAIREIATNATDAARVAREAVATVQAATSTIAQLGESSVEISEVLRVITAIAEQTNLLALNATIEAARAGEAGKGFAVVAGEVKDLAQQTAAATGDIAGRVAAIQSNSAEATTAVENVREIINRINDYQSTIAAAVEEQTATTGEMQRNVHEAASSTSEIAQNVTAVASATQATKNEVDQELGAIERIEQLSTQLAGLVGRFRY